MKSLLRVTFIVWTQKFKFDSFDGCCRYLFEAVGQSPRLIFDLFKLKQQFRNGRNVAAKFWQCAGDRRLDQECKIFKPKLAN